MKKKCGSVMRSVAIITLLNARFNETLMHDSINMTSSSEPSSLEISPSHDDVYFQVCDAEFLHDVSDDSCLPKILHKWFCNSATIVVRSQS